MLYVREGCHLCEEAADLLDRIVGRDAYVMTDIEADDALVARYAHRIPVLAVDGVDRLEGLITAGELREVLGDRAPA